MKRCPECRRDYVDDSLLYWLEDGSPRVPGGVASRDELPTAMFGEQTATAPLDGDRPGSGEKGNSIAVLPFANISADEDNEYFCDGLGEELRNGQAKIEGLKV